MYGNLLPCPHSAPCALPASIQQSTTAMPPPPTPRLPPDTCRRGCSSYRHTKTSKRKKHEHTGVPRQQRSLGRLCAPGPCGMMHLQQQQHSSTPHTGRKGAPARASTAPLQRRELDELAKSIRHAAAQSHTQVLTPHPYIPSHVTVTSHTSSPPLSPLVLSEASACSY